MFFKINTILPFLHLKLPVIKHLGLNLIIETLSLSIALGIWINLREVLSSLGSAATVLLCSPCSFCLGKVDIAEMVYVLLVNLLSFGKRLIVAVANLWNR